VSLGVGDVGVTGGKKSSGNRQVVFGPSFLSLVSATIDIGEIVTVMPPDIPVARSPLALLSVVRLYDPGVE